MVFIQITAQLDLQLSYGFCNCLGNEKRQDAINTKDSTLDVVIKTIFSPPYTAKNTLHLHRGTTKPFYFPSKDGSHASNHTGSQLSIQPR